MVIVTDYERVVKLKDGTKKKIEGYYMDSYLAENLLPIPQYLNDAWDVVGIISGHGKVRIGKTIHPGVTTIRVKEKDKIIDKKLSDFKDGDFINTLSWDFKNNKEVDSISELIIEKDEKDFFEVELENGKKIVCTKEHKLFVNRDNKIIELKLKDIKDGDEIVCHY